MPHLKHPLPNKGAVTSLTSRPNERDFFKMGGGGWYPENAFGKLPLPGDYRSPLHGLRQILGSFQIKVQVQILTARRACREMDVIFDTTIVEYLSDKTI